MGEHAHVRTEWGVQKNSYPLGDGLRLYGDDEAGAREAAPKVTGSGAFVVCREVITVTTEWHRPPTQPAANQEAGA